MNVRKIQVYLGSRVVPSRFDLLRSSGKAGSELRVKLASAPNARRLRLFGRHLNDDIHWQRCIWTRQDEAYPQRACSLGGHSRRTR